MAQKYSIQLLTATTAEWNESQYVIPKGELVAEVLTDGKIQLKVGNGLHKFSELAYVASSSTEGGSGAPGYAPTVSVVKVDNTATITITDKEGDHTFTVQDGVDGVSPTVSISKTGDVATVTITDSNGDHTFTIKDGINGTSFTFDDLTDAQKLELKGDTGEGFEVQGTYDTIKELMDNVIAPSPGIAYGVGLEAPYDIYIYDGVKQAWVNHGQLQGAKGDAFTYDDFTDEQLAALKVVSAPDTEMSDESVNAVQNRVIKAYIDNLIGDIESAIAEIDTILGGE
jgi:hypothetical protein